MGEGIKVTFSKTRICYFDNAQSTLKKGDTDAFTTNTWNTNDANHMYEVVRYPSAKHGWSFIPFDRWGLYVTSAELYSLYENFDTFTPTMTTAVLGHCVPLATYPGTASTTQLSFNNTIYSLTYKLNDVDMVTNDVYLDDDDIAFAFFKTFDGANYTDGTRLTLPKPDILYKIPSSTTSTARAGGIQTYPQQINVTNPAAPGDSNIAIRLSQNQLKETYVPEFLQDNQNVCALYPGENQDEFTYINPDGTFNTVDARSASFGEMWQNLDSRNYGMNTNVTFNEAGILNTNIWVRTRGPISRPDNGEGFSTDATVNAREREERWSYGETKNLFWAEGPNKWWIKGLPILEGANLIPHNFCCTITWTLDIKGKPRTALIPRPLKFGYCNQFTENYLALSGTTSVLKTQHQYYKSWPKKPFHDHMLRSNYKIPRLTRNEWVTVSTASIQDATNTTPGVNNLDDNEEVDPIYFRKHPITDIATTTFLKRTPPTRTTRSATAKRRKTSVAKDTDFEML